MTKTLTLEIPKRGRAGIADELFNHQARLNANKTARFARVREILGGYPSAELIEILVDKAIEAYDDGEKPNPAMLPKNHPDAGGEGGE